MSIMNLVVVYIMGASRWYLGASDGAMDSDLLVPPDTERSDRVAGFGEHWRLASQLLQHL